MRQKGNRRLRLLMTTSVVALAVVIAPVAVDSVPHGSLMNQAEASSCFVAGTRVLMADFSECPIERVAIGDHVMGPAGKANRVIGMERPALGGRALYSFGEGLPFVTAEHPFRTREGWKAIDPAATRIENANLTVGRLRAFDRVAIACLELSSSSDGNAALALSPMLGIEYQVVGRIVAHAADPTTRVYNLLLDGDHAYFANGYLVHNKDGGSGSGSGGSGSGSGSGGDGGSGGEGGSGSGSGSSGSSGSGSGSGSSGGEGGSSGPGDGGGGEGGDGSDGGSSGSGGEGGESGSDGDSGGEGGEAGSGGSFNGVSQKGPDLTPAQEAEAIANGWK